MTDHKRDAPQLPPDFDWKAFTPEDSPKGLPDVMREHADLSTADLRVGDPAFDFELPIFDFSSGAAKKTERKFHLSALAATRPVALIFGSYT